MGTDDEQAGLERTRDVGEGRRGVALPNLEPDALGRQRVAKLPQAFVSALAHGRDHEVPAREASAQNRWRLGNGDDVRQHELCSPTQV